MSLLAISFSLQSFFLRCHSFSLAFFSLLVFSSSITWSACQHFLHIGSRDCQVDFVGNGFLVVASCSQSCHNIGRFFGGVVFPARFSASAPITFFSSVGFFCQPCGLTKRAPDKWDSARFTSIFLASSFFYISNIVHARPLAGNANRWATPCKIKSKETSE